MHTARRRRIRFGLRTVLVSVAATAAVGMLNLLAERYSARLDVTQTGEQHLAPRTVRLLESLKKPYRVVIAAPMKSLDRRGREKVSDVLREMQRTTKNLSTIAIDTNSPQGALDYRDLVRELVERDEDSLAAQRATIELSVGGLAALSTYLNDTFSPAMSGVREAISPGTPAGQKNREFFEQAGAAARIQARELTRAGARATELLAGRLDDLALPATDKAAAAIIDVLGPAVDQLTTLSREIKKFAEAGATVGPAADVARPLVAEIERRRDQAAVLLDPLVRMKRLDLLRITDALSQGSAVLLIGPKEAGIAAMEVETIFPSAEWLEAAGLSAADLGRRAEEFLSTGLASLSGPPKPILVLIHADPQPFIEASGYFTKTIERLRLRGVDVVEWACVAQAEPPSLLRLDPDMKRPVVYASLAADSAAPGGARGEATGAQRAAKLAQTLASLVDKGANVLLSINPCVMPTYGEKDPSDLVLAKFGLTALSARPILSESFVARGGGGRVVSPHQILIPPEVDHPISSAVRGLRTIMPWPIPLGDVPIEQGVRQSRTDIYTIQPSDNLWAESQWLKFWQTNASERGLLRDPPAFDVGRDARAPETAPGATPRPWVVACAVEKTGSAGRQRLVAVGSNGWFVDGVTQATKRIDGRAMPVTPGNIELLEASISWLAGQDEFIAQSPSSAAVATIRDLSPRQLLLLRLVLMCGVPVGVLMLGVVYRVVRG